MLIETKQYKDCTIEIHTDMESMSPREDADNFGTMICWHKRYILGDVDDTFYLDKIYRGSPGEFKEWAEDQNVIKLPLYLYDHSGITMATTPFSCPWDSGQVGWIYITRGKLKEEFGEHYPESEWEERAIENLKAEVKEYDQFLTGEVYGFIVKQDIYEDLGEESCWGFYGDEYAKEEGLSTAEYVQDKIDKRRKVEQEEEGKEREKWAKNMVFCSCNL